MGKEKCLRPDAYLARIDSEATGPCAPSEPIADAENVKAVLKDRTVINGPGRMIVLTAILRDRQDFNAIGEPSDCYSFHSLI
jgi:hypothetical protein